MTTSHKTYKGKIISKEQADLFDDNTVLPKNGVFVFGTNTQGRHGKGAALQAKKYFDARYGLSKGLVGKQSWGIVTKDLTKTKHPSISKEEIQDQIIDLYNCARLPRKDQDFYISYGIEPNLNGYTPQEMADMFSCVEIPENIIFNEEFVKLLKR